MLLCRLTFDAPVVDGRLARRNVDDSAGLKWDLKRTVELAAILEVAALDDLVIDTSTNTARQTALDIGSVARW